MASAGRQAGRQAGVDVNAFLIPGQQAVTGEAVTQIVQPGPLAKAEDSALPEQSAEGGGNDTVPQALPAPANIDAYE